MDYPSIASSASFIVECDTDNKQQHQDTTYYSFVSPTETSYLVRTDTEDTDASNSSFLEIAAKSMTDIADVVCSPLKFSLDTNEHNPLLCHDEPDTPNNEAFLWTEHRESDSTTLSCSKNPLAYVISESYETALGHSKRLFDSVVQKMEIDIIGILSCSQGPTQQEREGYWKQIVCKPIKKDKELLQKKTELEIRQQNTQITKIQNRIGTTLHARANKIRQLREEMEGIYHNAHPITRRTSCDTQRIDLHDKENHASCENFTEKATTRRRSMDELDLTMNKDLRKGLNQSPLDRNVITPEKSEFKWNRIACNFYEPAADLAERNEDEVLHDEKDLCYDSDPGEATARGHLVVITNRAEWKARGAQSSPGGKRRSSHYKRPQDHYSSYLSNGQGSVAPRIDVDQVIQETIHRTMALIWHPPPCASSMNVPARSIFVEAWIEQGSRLRKRTIEPKFMWREFHQPELKYKKQLNQSFKDPYHMQLMAICRILPVDDSMGTFNREHYPFAKPSCCFTIQTYDSGWYLFEATSQDERDYIVQSLKLVVSRLISQAVAGDTINLLNDFFIPAEYDVSGGFQ